MFLSIIISILFIMYSIIYFVGHSVSFYVYRIHPINIKTAEPIEPKLFFWPQMTPELVDGRSKYNNLDFYNLKQINNEKRKICEIHFYKMQH